jgi:hypothetical protein
MDRIGRLICLIALIAALWVSSSSVIELWGYIRLRESTGVETAEWTVDERFPGSFFLQADYTFFVSGQKVCGNTNFNHPVFNTAEKARSFINAVDQVSWVAYYDNTPPYKSTLQKIFPIVACIKPVLAIFLWVALVFMERIFLRRV